MSDYGFQFETDSGKTFRLDEISPFTLLDTVYVEGDTRSYTKTYANLIGKNCDVYCLDEVRYTSNTTKAIPSYTFNKSTGKFSYSLSSNTPVAWVVIYIYVRFY